MVARKKTSTQEQEGQVEEVLSADELKAVSEGEPVESAVHKKRTVVVAEDESVNRMDLVAMLEDNGYEVVGEAANGEEAVDLTRKFRPDIVCMDVKMPRMDGIAAAGVICDENIAPRGDAHRVLATRPGPSGDRCRCHGLRHQAV